jgi:hypothetical protein
VRYWEGAPPVHEAFAAFIGHKRKSPDPAAANEDPFEALKRDFSGLG